MSALSNSMQAARSKTPRVSARSSFRRARCWAQIAAVRWLSVRKWRSSISVKGEDMGAPWARAKNELELQTSDPANRGIEFIDLVGNRTWKSLAYGLLFRVTSAQSSERRTRTMLSDGFIGPALLKA